MKNIISKINRHYKKINTKLSEFFTHYRKATFYSSREKVMGFIIFFCVICFICFFAFLLMGMPEYYVKFGLGYFILLLLAFWVLMLYMKFRNQLIMEYDINEFDDYLDNLQNKYNRLVADVFIYGLWNYIEKFDVLYEMFESGNYIDREDIKQRDYIIISFFRCITYQLDGRTYRIPKYFKNMDLFKKILDHYSEIMDKKKNKEDTVGRKDLFINLENYELDYEISFERQTARDNRESLTSSGGIIETFTVLSNNEKQIHAIKKVIAVSALIIMILHLSIDWEEFNVGATFVFEFITVFFMFVDVSKDKDYRYLH